MSNGWCVRNTTTVRTAFWNLKLRQGWERVSSKSDNETKEKRSSLRERGQKQQQRQRKKKKKEKRRKKKEERKNHESFPHLFEDHVTRSETDGFLVREQDGLAFRLYTRVSARQTARVGNKISFVRDVGQSAHTGASKRSAVRKKT